MIKEKYTEFLNREKIKKNTKYKEKQTHHLTKSKEKPEKDYDYYKCDYCGEEIKILKKHHEMAGGIVIIPASLTKRQSLKLVLCNKCLKPVIQEFEGEK